MCWDGQRSFPSQLERAWRVKGRWKRESAPGRSEEAELSRSAGHDLVTPAVRVRADARTLTGFTGARRSLGSHLANSRKMNVFTVGTSAAPHPGKVNIITPELLCSRQK